VDVATGGTGCIARRPLSLPAAGVLEAVVSSSI
jgi:hypothetical protein